MVSREKPRILISDKLSPAALKIFRARGVKADQKTDLSKEELSRVIGAYDGLAVRSATKVTPSLLSAAKRLRIVGRAGIGIDNIDLDAASRAGVIVMNAPLGNSITTAEHAIAMMMALARQIPQADRSTQAGKWEKSRFMGVELAGKLLGLIGCGNIGSLVAERALGLKMKVAAADPFLSEARAAELRVEKMELAELFRRADIISLHAPLTEKTRQIIRAETIEMMKEGVFLVNCARGSLVREADLEKALRSGKIAAAALDVFAEEPAKNNPLFGLENVVCTPHLGASTTEAQEKVAMQIAEQMADYLLTGAVSHALNMPSVSAEEAPRLAPFLALAERLGLFMGQILQDPLSRIHIEYAGEGVERHRDSLTAAALKGALSPSLAGVNMVRAPALAKERGISVSEEMGAAASRAYENYIRLRLISENSEISVGGTVFSDGKPRIIQTGGVNMESEFAPHMLYSESRDQPGFIGALGQILGAAKVNIASLSLGRDKPEGRAVALIAVDDAVPESAVRQIHAMEGVERAHALSFAPPAAALRFAR